MEETGWWMAERDDFKGGYWSRVEIPTGCKSFFSLIFVYKVTSMNSYILWRLYQFVWFLYTNWLVRIRTYYDVCTNLYIFMWFLYTNWLVQIRTYNDVCTNSYIFYVILYQFVQYLYKLYNTNSYNKPRARSASREGEARAHLLPRPGRTRLPRR